MSSDTFQYFTSRSKMTPLKMFQVKMCELILKTKQLKESNIYWFASKFKTEVYMITLDYKYEMCLLFEVSWHLSEASWEIYDPRFENLMGASLEKYQKVILKDGFQIVTGQLLIKLSRRGHLRQRAFSTSHYFERSLQGHCHCSLVRNV